MIDSAFWHILFKEGQGVGPCWAHSHPKGPKGQGYPVPAGEAFTNAQDTHA